MSGEGEGAREGRTLVVGVGNLLLSDDGLGVHVARALLAREESLGPDVAVLEAGTAVFAAAGALTGVGQLVLVDAVRAGGAPGEVYRFPLEPGDLDEPRGPGEPLSLHDRELLDELRDLRTAGLLPARVRLIGAEPLDLSPGTALSAPLAGAAKRIVEEILAGFGPATRPSL